MEALEQIANIHVEKLPEGGYLATSKDIPGLVAQERFKHRAVVQVKQSPRYMQSIIRINTNEVSID